MSYGEETHKPWLLTVVHNLREFDKTRDIVVITPPVAPTKMRQDLQKLNAQVREMPAVGGPEQCQRELGQGNRRLINSFFKMNIWNLTEYDALLYLESDMLVREPLEEIFQKFRRVEGKDAILIAPMGHRECPEGEWKPSKAPHVWNTGIIALRPNPSFAQSYWDLVHGGRRRFSCEGGSQTLENILFLTLLQYPYTSDPPHLTCMAPRFNCKTAQCAKHAAVIHWTGDRKPWDLAEGFEEFIPHWKEKRREAAEEEQAVKWTSSPQIAEERLFQKLTDEWIGRLRRVTKLMHAPDRGGEELEDKQEKEEKV